MNFIVNSGIIWGIGAKLGQYWIWLIGGTLLLMIRVFGWSLGTVLILVGGLSNLIDRIRFGGVVDYISIGWWPSFNLADCFILAGVVILLYSRWYERTSDSLRR
ncbi:MAG: signal peptidase II [Candidatus Beckwithbacteria bacterium]|nr:signal peptidase II [Candidatus Beckwithbacteria bacterium]